MRYTRYVVAVGLAGSVALMFQNCGKMSSGVSNLAKESLLESKKVFSASNTASSSGEYITPSSPTVSLPSAESTSQPASFICSNNQSQKSGNLQLASSMVLNISKKASSAVAIGNARQARGAVAVTPDCSFEDHNLAQEILSIHGFPQSMYNEINDNCKLADGEYALNINVIGPKIKSTLNGSALSTISSTSVNYETPVAKQSLRVSKGKVSLSSSSLSNTFSIVSNLMNSNAVISDKLSIVAAFNPELQNSLSSIIIGAFQSSKTSASSSSNTIEGESSSGNTQTNSASASNNIKCDQTASPLMVELSDNGEYLNLTSQTDGVQFDILGRNADPVAHSKNQISWSKSENFYFITLPDSQGSVSGIDQMFGNNTFGPDQDFSDNGYLALAKYDSNGDGYITSKDTVFSKLRLWKDDNADGIAQGPELHTLNSLNVTSIDLHYDADYKETDKYGNEARMKSAVTTLDGKLHLLFDLWFAY